MSRSAGVKRAATTAGRRAVKAGRGRVRAAGQWLGLAEGGSAAPSKRLTWGNVPEPVRRAGRWLLVRGLASAAFRPGRWAGGGALIGALLVGFPWGVAGALLPPSLTLARALRGEDDLVAAPRSSILFDVSSRVKTLRLARRLRRGWAREMNRLGLAQQRNRRGQAEAAVPRLDRLRLGPWGVTAEVDLHRLGMVVGDLAKHQERLESVFLARFHIHKRGYGTAVVEARHTDPLSRPVAVDALPAARRRLHVVTRIAEDGAGVEQDVILPRLVVGGQGSGKSTELKAFLHELQRAGVPFRLRAFDPKGGMELPELRQVAHRYESRAARWADFLGDALGALAARQRSLAARGWSKLTRFTESEPLDILIIDELLSVVGQSGATVKADRVGTMSAADAFEQYLSQGRAAGYTAFALTQLGQKEVLGNARGLFPHLTVLRMPQSEKEIVDRLIGADHPAYLIPPGPRYAGVGYLRDPEGRIVRSRGAMLTDQQWAEVVGRIGEDKARREAARRARREKAGAAV